ncbi:phosphofructokinase family protein, partial [Chlamydia psittaci 84-8471/1]
RNDRKFREGHSIYKKVPSFCPSYGTKSFLYNFRMWSTDLTEYYPH